MGEVVDIEQAVLEEKDQITGLIPASQQAIDLPDCKIHNFVFLRTAKKKTKTKQPAHEGPPLEFRRIDTFYCTHCLRYTTMERKEFSSYPPDWYRDDR